MVFWVKGPEGFNMYLGARRSPRWEWDLATNLVLFSVMPSCSVACLQNRKLKNDPLSCPHRIYPRAAWSNFRCNNISLNHAPCTIFIPCICTCTVCWWHAALAVSPSEQGCSVTVCLRWLMLLCIEKQCVLVEVHLLLITVTLRREGARLL